MALILAHDLLAAVAAVVAAFYIRFEAAGPRASAGTLLLLLLPGFVVYSAGVFSIFGLYKTKWRFTSLPDLMTISRPSTVLAVTLLVLDYVLLAPNVYGTFFFGKITIVLYWFLQMFFLARLAHRLPLFPLHPHAAARHGAASSRRRSCSAAPPTPRCCCAAIESGAVKKHPGRSASCRRRRPTAASRSAACRCSATSTTSSAWSPISPTAAPR